MAAKRVGTHEAKTHLSEYINRVRYGGERILIERHGKPVAALVNTEDLARLEGEQPAPEKSAEERYREALAEAGIRVSWTRPPGEARKKVPRERRRLIEVEGEPVSEQIIRERR